MTQAPEAGEVVRQSCCDGGTRPARQPIFYPIESCCDSKKTWADPDGRVAHTIRGARQNNNRLEVVEASYRADCLESPFWGPASAGRCLT